MKLTNYSIVRARLPLKYPIGDSQVRFDEHWMTVLQLETDNGLKGVGFELQQGMPIADVRELTAQFAFNPWPSIVGREIPGLCMAISRPRGGNVGAAVLGLATETALWDLFGKLVGRPLYKLFGGQKNEIRAYASTLDFHLSDDEFRRRLNEFRQHGLRDVKIKVGHPDVEWDISRLGIAREVMGADAALMADANEAWTVKETMIRVDRYERAGFNLFWLEDPITREDYDGYRTLAQQLGTTRINTGEYLGFGGKRRLLENHAVDVMNIHGHFRQSRLAAQLAGDYGIPVSLGNTILELGVHIAASCPECLFLEFSDLRWNELAVSPVQFRDGYAIAPERSGHGIEIAQERLTEFEC